MNYIKFRKINFSTTCNMHQFKFKKKIFYTRRWLKNKTPNLPIEIF